MPDTPHTPACQARAKVLEKIQHQAFSGGHCECNTELRLQALAIPCDCSILAALRQINKQGINHSTRRAQPPLQGALGRERAVPS